MSNVDRIRTNHGTGMYSPHTAQTSVEGATVHELGHTRANLTHLCEDPDNHNDSRCIMSENLPTTNCQHHYDVFEYGIRYCGMCNTNLKDVKW